MMRARTAYVPLDVADRFGGFILARDEMAFGAVRARTRDYSTLTMIKLLYQLRDGPARFSELHRRSMIMMKRTFLDYLGMCVEYDFVRRDAAGRHVTYSLTDRGMTMLDLFDQKGRDA